MKRLARCALAALLAASFAAPVYASPPPVLAPVAIVRPAETILAPAIAQPAPQAASTADVWTAPLVMPTDTPVPTLPTVQDAKDYALAQLGPTQFACLNSIVMAESRWNPLASNPGGAYGIPQSWPAEKMASAGADWRTNPLTQTKWLLWYVEAKYVTACNAAAYRDRNGIY